jgi:hypothetical protein
MFYYEGELEKANRANLKTHQEGILERIRNIPSTSELSWGMGYSKGMNLKEVAGNYVRH